MKKIILILTLLPWMLFATTNNLSGNFSTGSILATDTVILAGNAVVDGGTYTFKALWIPAGTNYTLSESGTSLIILTGNGLFWKDSSTGIKTYPDSVSVENTSGRMVVSSQIGSFPNSNCSWHFAGIDTLYDYKGVGGKLLHNVSSYVIQNSTTSTGLLWTAGTLITIENNGTWTVNGNGLTLNFNAGSNQNVLSTGTSSQINGSGVITINAGSGANVLIDTFCYTGTASGGFNIRSSANGPGATATMTQGICLSKSLNIYKSSGVANYTFSTGNYPIDGTSLNIGNGTATAGSTFNFNAGSSILTFLYSFSSAGFNNTGGYVDWGSGNAYWGQDFTYGSTLNVTPGTRTHNFNGTAAQIITSAGKQWYGVVVNNTGTATIKFTDSLSCLGDLSLLNGRDSLSKIRCVNYTNTTDDSVFQTDTGYVSGNWLRNNAKVSRVGGRWVHVGSANTQITLQDAGTIGPITVRKSVSTATLTAASNIRAWRIRDTIGPLIMGSYSVACTTFKNYAVGTQLAAVTLDTLDQFKTMALGGGTITRWNWGANNIGANLATGTTLTVTSIDGIGGTAGAPDTLQGVGGSAGLAFAGGDMRDTASYLYVQNIALAAGDTLDLRDGTSIDGGGNTGAILWPSGAFKKVYRVWRRGVYEVGVWARSVYK